MDKLNATLKALEKSAGRHSKSALIAGGLLVEGEAKRSIMEISSGTTVTRYRNGGGSYSHVAASKGSAPNNDTGTLVRGINTEVTEEGVFVGTTVPHGFFLEFSHPWLIPALSKKSDDIIKLQIDAVNKSIAENEHVI